MSKGLEALERLMTDYYEMCQDLGSNDDQYQRWNLTSERAIIKKELEALELIRKCFYIAKSSGAILLTDYGFDHKEELKEALL